MDQHWAYGWRAAAQQRQPSQRQQPPRPRVAGTTRVPVVTTLRGDPPRVAGGRETLRGAAVWEFFEKGWWKPMPLGLQDFLNEQWDDWSEEAHMFLNDDQTKMYCWDFVELKQTRWHLIGADEWENVKTRSIRRAQILSAPANVVG